MFLRNPLKLIHLWIIIVLLNTFDVIFTMYFISEQGVSIELNPLIKWGITNYTPYSMIVFKAMPLILFLYLTKYEEARYSFKLVITIYTVLIVYEITLGVLYAFS